MTLESIEDIDILALCDKIFELLAALLVSVLGLSVVLSYHICKTFWATAGPFIVSSWNWLATVTIGVKNFMVAHPIITVAILFGPGLTAEFWKLLLYCLGFRDRGVEQGSYAAQYQSKNYAGKTPKDSTFARLQSQGMKGRG